MSTGAPVNFSFSSPQDFTRGVPNFGNDWGFPAISRLRQLSCKNPKDLPCPLPGLSFPTYNGKNARATLSDWIRMTRLRLILLAFGLGSAPAFAGVAVDLSFGQSVSGSINTGKSSPLSQQSFALSGDYVGNMKRGLLGSNERWSLGLGLYTAQVSYNAGGVKNTGGNFFLTARTGWMAFVGGKNWLVQLTPEFIIFSRMSVASYSQSTIDGENFQSASLSTYAGNGSIRVPLYVGKKMNWKLGKAELFLGGSLSTLIQSFSQRNDTVVATSPSTGKVNSLEKNTSGSYQLQAMSLSFHLTFIL
jgi:hypothetical protein